MTAESAVKLVEALATLAWPLLAGLLVWKLYPALSTMVRSRTFTIKVGTMEISAQEANEQLANQVRDLKAQLATLRERVEGTAPALLAGAAASPQPVPAEPAPAARTASRKVLWVDDHPENNVYELSDLGEIGLQVEQVRSTAEALSRLDASTAGYALVITDLGRTEDGRYDGEAGLKLVQAIRQRDPALPVFVYASKKGVRTSAARLAEAGATGSTGSPAELFELVTGIVGGRRPEA